MKRIIILIIFSCLAGTSLAVNVSLYPGLEFYNGNITVSFSDNVTVSYFELGENYVVFQDLNLSVTCSNNIHLNFSYVNSSGIPVKDNRILTFNATYSSGSVTFLMKGNITGTIYRVLRDNILFSTHENKNISWVSNSWSKHEFSILLEGIRPDSPYNGTSTYSSAHNTVNLTWQRGNRSNREIVVMNTDSYPTSPSDGTIYQNSTNTSYNFTVNQSGYFTIWSYNDTTGYFSNTGLNIPWGALRVNVFNASKTWEVVSPFGIIIQNIQGTQLFKQTTCSPPFYLDISELPVGSDSLFIINSSGYQQQSYSRDTNLNNYWNYTFLLPPVTTNTPGQGDEDPVTGDTTDVTETQLYLITLYNELDQTIPSGKIVFSMYVNETDTYEETGSFTTDGAGQGTIWLVPKKLYQITCTANSYKDNISYWVPSNLIFTKSFKLEFLDDEIQPAMLPYEYVFFNGTRTNTTLTLFYRDTLNQTINTTLYVYEINRTTGDISLFYTSTSTDINSWMEYLTGLDSNCSYQAVLKYNHTIFGNQDPTRMFPFYNIKLTTPGGFNTLMTNIFGPNPLVWSHLVMFCLLVAGFFFADQQDAGKMMIILGGLFIFINVYIGFDDALLAAAGGIIPGLLILFGIIIDRNTSKNFGGG